MVRNNFSPAKKDINEHSKNENASSDESRVNKEIREVVILRDLLQQGIPYSQIYVMHPKITRKHYMFMKLFDKDKRREKRDERRRLREEKISQESK